MATKKPAAKKAPAKKAAAKKAAVDCTVSRNGDIKPKVINSIRARAVLNHAPADKLILLDHGFEALGLEELNLDSGQRRLLAVSYTAASQVGHPCGKVVQENEAKDAKTLGAAIDLVHKRSEGK